MADPSLPDVRRMSLEEIKAVPRWRFDPHQEDRTGRVEIWEEPVTNYRYAVGADFALGIEGRDYDAVIVLDVQADPPRQVAEAHGHWGEDEVDRVIYALQRYYGRAFLVGERQFGLAPLRRLLAMGAWLYFDRREEARNRAQRDVVGYWRGDNDVTLPNLRRRIRDRKLIVRSEATLRELGRLQYAPGQQFASHPEDAQDKHLDVKLAGGRSPDLVMACAYAVHALAEMGKFEEEEQPFDPGTLGDVLGHNEEFFRPSEHRPRRRR